MTSSPARDRRAPAMGAPGDDRGELAAFCRDPVGRAAAQGSTHVWFPRAGFRAMAVWGAPDRADVATLVRVMDAVLQPRVAPHAALVDLRHLERIDVGGMGPFLAFMASRSADLRRVVRRSAAVLGGGEVGARLAGYARLIAFPFDVGVFAEPAEAAAWLGADVTDAELRELDARTARHRDADPLLRALRAALREAPAEATVESCASRLAVAPRTLQRALQQSGTSLRAEVRDARVERAQALLEDGDRKLLAIALEVGFGKAQSLVAAFVDRVGMHPRAWQRARRGA